MTKRSYRMTSWKCRCHLSVSNLDYHCYESGYLLGLVHQGTAEIKLGRATDAWIHISSRRRVGNRLMQTLIDMNKAHFSRFVEYFIHLLANRRMRVKVRIRRMMNWSDWLRLTLVLSIGFRQILQHSHTNLMTKKVHSFFDLPVHNLVWEATVLTSKNASLAWHGVLTVACILHIHVFRW